MLIAFDVTDNSPPADKLVSVTLQFKSVASVLGFTRLVLSRYPTSLAESIVEFLLDLGRTITACATAKKRRRRYVWGEFDDCVTPFTRSETA
jgi:hypothetical protein